MEEQEQDWRGLMFDKFSIVCSLLYWDLGRVMILEEQLRDWRSKDEIGGVDLIFHVWTIMFLMSR